jgi:hypothetical protein
VFAASFVGLGGVVCFGWCWVLLGAGGVVGRGCENVRRMNRTNDRHRAERVVEMIRNLQRLDGW